LTGWYIVQYGAYCLDCAIFPRPGGGKGCQTLGYLVHTKFFNWKNARETFKNHAETKYHSESKVAAANFMAVSSGKQQPVDQQVNSGLKRQVRLYEVFEFKIMSTLRKSKKLSINNSGVPVTSLVYQFVHVHASHAIYSCIFF